MKRQCAHVSEDGRRCKSPFVLAETGMCRVHSLSPDEWKAQSARGGRREKQVKFEANEKALANRKPQMSGADKLLIADTIHELLRAITFEPDTARAVPDEERRAIGVYLASQFFDHDEEVQRLVKTTLRGAEHDPEATLRRAVVRHGLQPTAELIASVS